MAPGTPHPCLRLARLCGHCLGCFVVWTVWLGLALLLVGQAYVATRDQLEIPPFLLRALEARLAVSGVTVRFGGALFDPSGRILVEDARIRLDSFTEPVATARTLYLRLDPWSLLAGRLEPTQIRATGVNLLIPAMLSASGRAEELVRELDVGLTLEQDVVRIDYLNFRLAGIAVSGHGAVQVGDSLAFIGSAARRGAPRALAPAEFFARNYATLSKEFGQAVARLEPLEQPIVQTVLIPSPTRGAIVHASVFARGLTWGGVRIGPVSAFGRLPLLGSAPVMATFDLAADEVALANGARARGVRAAIRGPLNIEAMTFRPRQLQATVRTARWQGLTAEAIQLRLEPDSLSHFRGDVIAEVMAQPVAVAGEVDLARRAADVRFDAALAPGWIGPLSTWVGQDVRRYVDFDTPLAVAGRVQFTDGWKFKGLSTRLSGRNLRRLGLAVNRLEARVELDPHRLFAPEAYAQIGDNFARGSYEQNLATRDFRFLLKGQLRPLDIAPWFGPWWPAFFGDYAFPVAPAEATVDLQGRWGQDERSSQFVVADVAGIAIRGVAFDWLRTRMFIRPGWYDAMEVAAARGAAEARGRFLVQAETRHGEMTSLDFDGTSSVELGIGGRLIGPVAAEVVAPFWFAEPPRLTLRGHFDGVAAPEPHHQQLHVEARTDQAMTYRGIPFEPAAFTVDLNDDDLAVRQVDAGFAGGSLTGQALVSGVGPGRHIAFAGTLNRANLGQAATAAAGFFSTAGTSPSSWQVLAREQSGTRMDLSMSAEGLYDDPATLHGEGNVMVQGPGLGGVPLLGGLSRLLRVTALRFTTAQSAFKVDAGRLDFPDLTVTGANSAIRARGTYEIERHRLDFHAKIYPFLESKSILQVFNVLSTPISAALQVRLTGSIEKPAWAFTYGPLNLMRGNGGGSPAMTAPPSPLAVPPE
jgi:hypothetical protein